ncbi:MAG: acyltransferase [Candidatus Thorarchaeota archaeon]
MNDTSFQMYEQELILSSRKTHFFQVDLLKTIMIFLVIFDHFVSWNIKRDIGVALWERISIPVFLIILGFNMGCSFEAEGQISLKKLYSRNYFKKKVLRYIIPFIILYAASTFIGSLMYGFDFEAMYFGQYYPDHGIINLFYFILPFWGPGNWFIPVLFQSILVLPLLYWAFKKKPILSLIATFIIEIAMQIIGVILIGETFTSWEQVHIYSLMSCSVLFYLSAIGLGMWFSFGYKITEKRNRFMWILFPISLVYLIAYQFFNFRLKLDNIPLLRGDYHLLVFPYSAFLILLALNFLPRISNRGISKTISLISNSTYHILLTQILGYGMVTAWWGTHYGMDIPFNPLDLIDLVFIWLLFIWFGILWYKIDKQKNIIRKILYYINFFIVFSCILLFTFWLQGFWVPIPLIIIIGYALATLIFHYSTKRSLNTKLLTIWTGFLVLCFISMILQVYIISISFSWILLIPIGIYLLFGLYSTASYKI